MVCCGLCHIQVGWLCRFHKDGTPILTDFGVARQLESDMSLTMEGSAVGSPYYLSPEQAECKPLDGRTDIS